MNDHPDEMVLPAMLQPKMVQNTQWITLMGVGELATFGLTPHQLAQRVGSLLGSLVCDGRTEGGTVLGRVLGGSGS